MRQYISLVNEVLDNAPIEKHKASSEYVRAIPGAMIKHDMSTGAPVLTTKKMYFHGVKTELEMFLRGITDKRWLQERKVHIWDQWQSPTMNDENDLGPIYGFQWRNFDAKYKGKGHVYKGEGIDQVANAINRIKKDPSTRKAIVSAWNPNQLHMMGLEPCHMFWHIDVIDGRLNLYWHQRSGDIGLGIPFNLASYGLLHHLITKELDYEPGYLVGFIDNAHIYETHIPMLEKQIRNKPKTLPQFSTEKFTGVLNWRAQDTKLVNYEHHEYIKFPRTAQVKNESRDQS